MVELKPKLLFPAILLMAVVFISGCVQQTTTPSGTGQEQTTQPKVQYKDSSNFLLNITDLPQNANWTLIETGERNVNDMSSKVMAYNWSGGYYAIFSLSEKDKVTYLHHYLSIYPKDRIIEVLGDDSDLGEPLSNPAIGNNSRAYKIRETVLGQNVVNYKIVFAKNNIMATLMSAGTGNDYLKLKEFAQKAYDKIDGNGTPFDYLALKPASKTYTNNLYGFSIIQPSGWKINENTQAIITFKSPMSSSGNSALIGVWIYEFNISLFDTDANRNSFIDGLKQSVSNFALLEKKPMTINDRKAYSITFVNTIPAGENLAAQQVYIERNDKQVFLVAYVVDSKQFETYHDVFTNALNSFNVT